MPRYTYLTALAATCLLNLNTLIKQGVACAGNHRQSANSKRCIPLKTIPSLYRAKARLHLRCSRFVNHTATSAKQTGLLRANARIANLCKGQAAPHHSAARASSPAPAQHMSAEDAPCNTSLLLSTQTTNWHMKNVTEKTPPTLQNEWPMAHR